MSAASFLENHISSIWIFAVRYAADAQNTLFIGAFSIIARGKPDDLSKTRAEIINIRISDLFGNFPHRAAFGFQKLAGVFHSERQKVCLGRHSETAFEDALEISVTDAAKGAETVDIQVFVEMLGKIIDPGTDLFEQVVRNVLFFAL